MWDYIIDIHPSELLCTKTKESKINEHKKKIFKKFKYGQFTFFT